MRTKLPKKSFAIPNKDILPSNLWLESTNIDLSMPTLPNKYIQREQYPLFFAIPKILSIQKLLSKTIHYTIADYMHPFENNLQ